MFNTTVIAFKNILIFKFVTIVIAFALHIVSEFDFMKIDYVFLINVMSMFLNLIDQIHDVK